MNEQQKAKALEALQWLENRYQMMTNPAGAIEHTIDAVMEIRQCLAPVSDEGRNAALELLSGMPDEVYKDAQEVADWFENNYDALHIALTDLATYQSGHSPEDHTNGCSDRCTALSTPSMEDELAEALDEIRKTGFVSYTGKPPHVIAYEALAKYRAGQRPLK